MSRLASRVVSLGVAIVLSPACSPVERHKALTIFFDGVPPPKPAAPVETTPGTAPQGQQPARRPSAREHGPYAAKLCSACHEAAAMNALVLPKGELCAKCHDLRQHVTYVHGPLASGGCLACHDPHKSQFASLLVSASDTFCLRCHDARDISRIPGHGDGEANCTQCHDAHGSDRKYFLK